MLLATATRWSRTAFMAFHSTPAGQALFARCIALRCPETDAPPASIPGLLLEWRWERAVQWPQAEAASPGPVAMSGHFEPQRFDCDAPAYHVVRACQQLG